MQKTEKIIDPSARADAALSHSLPKQVKNVTASKLGALNQVHDHPRVGQHWRSGETRLVEHHPFQLQLDRRYVASGLRRAPLGHHACMVVTVVGWRLRRCLRIGIRLRARRNLLPTAIQPLLLAPSPSRSIVRDTPLTGLLSAMVLLTAKWTTQVPSTGVPGVRQKANPAVPAVNGTVLKLQMGSQNRVQRRLILPDKRFGPVVLVPILAKREKPLDAYSKKTRFSVIIPIVLDIPLSYFIDAKTSRSRARVFLRAGQQTPRTNPTNGSLCITTKDCSTCRTDGAHYASKSEDTTWKEGTILLSK